MSKLPTKEVPKKTYTTSTSNEGIVQDQTESERTNERAA